LLVDEINLFIITAQLTYQPTEDQDFW